MIKTLFIIGSFISSSFFLYAQEDSVAKQKIIQILRSELIGRKGEILISRRISGNQLLSRTDKYTTTDILLNNCLLYLKTNVEYRNEEPTRIDNTESLNNSRTLNNTLEFKNIDSISFSPYYLVADREIRPIESYLVMRIYMKSTTKTNTRKKASKRQKQPDQEIILWCKKNSQDSVIRLFHTLHKGCKN
ncbi:MAG: hypothetical protein H0W75_02835 [Chitinophagaceae bacterium]|nr:hypothetical protein [Chitinophagaceae bacterium]